MTAGAAVAAWSVHLPGLDPAAVPALDLGTAAGPDDAREVLGRKGLLAKDAATRLALCAVHRALGRPAGAPRPDPDPDPATAVVASSNLGNTATVRRVMATVAASGGRAVSPLDAPNASSNVVASSVALWFRWGGPNLMICSGATSGLDAVAVAVRLLGARRCDRVVVVGTEPGDEVARALHAGRGGGGPVPPLREGAACLVLERPATAPADAPRLGPVRPTTGPGGPGDGTGPGVAAAGVPVAGPVELGGDPYGSAGVVYAALAAGLVAAGAPGPVAAVCGDATDGWRSVLVTRGGPR